MALDIQDYVQFFEDEIKELGGYKRNKEKYILRKNINDVKDNKGAFFACISENQDKQGAYSDLSIVVFPSSEEEKDYLGKWIVSLGVGSLGFKDDYNLASLPGTRRSFVKKLPQTAYIKNDFTDIESTDGFNEFCNKNDIPESLANAVQRYKDVILAASIIEPKDEDGAKKIISKYLALYANLRQWPSNQSERNKVKEILFSDYNEINEEEEVRNILRQRKYIVLQGAPGTGKTRLAKEIVKKDDNSISFFTQFHAETTYSEFIYGIMPDTEEEELIYKSNEGIFVKVIRTAVENEDKNVYLIIDEINRANLSSVLGPAFYLFEPNMQDSDVKIEICPGLSLSKLPDNFYVIATMNTADRSLAVIDFALRRRFAWYTLYPHEVDDLNDDQVFCKKEFFEIADLFEKYADDQELTVQPGHSYFIVPKGDSNYQTEEIMESRLKYEIMPLIKEYLNEGMLENAKDAFINYFREKIGEEMFI